LLKAVLNVEVRPTVTSWCKEANIDPKTYYKWMRDAGFLAWFYRQWQLSMTQSQFYLETVGLRKAASDFRYWEAMMTRYHGYVRITENRNKNINLNKNIDANKRQLESTDVNAAKE